MSKVCLDHMEELVTLHVSVWVEIRIILERRLATDVTLHVSVWVEIKKFSHASRAHCVTLHVSVWVEMSIHFLLYSFIQCHAPRERVSWNLGNSYQLQNRCCHAPRERVSWNISRAEHSGEVISHAPRERVSWNLCRINSRLTWLVTLHVSVWVNFRFNAGLIDIE